MQLGVWSSGLPGEAAPSAWTILSPALPPLRAGRKAADPLQVSFQLQKPVVLSKGLQTSGVGLREVEPGHGDCNPQTKSRIIWGFLFSFVGK